MDILYNIKISPLLFLFFLFDKFKPLKLFFLFFLWILFIILLSKNFYKNQSLYEESTFNYIQKIYFYPIISLKKIYILAHSKILVIIP